MMLRARCRPNAGFTLLEVLVALGLLAMIVVLILSAIQGARRALDVAGRQTEEASTGSAQFVLRQIVAQARPIQMPAPSSQDGPMMDGKPESMRFITSFAAGGQYGGLIDTELLIRPAATPGASADLVIRQTIFRRPLPGATVTSGKGRDHIILPGIETLTLRYFGKPDDDSPPIWSQTWRYASRLPLLVEISVTFPPADPRRWPPLVIACRLVD